MTRDEWAKYATVRKMAPMVKRIVNSPIARNIDMYNRMIDQLSELNDQRMTQYYEASLGSLADQVDCKLISELISTARDITALKDMIAELENTDDEIGEPNKHDELLSNFDCEPPPGWKPKK